jgi:hypothetical protein
MDTAPATAPAPRRKPKGETWMCTYDVWQKDMPEETVRVTKTTRRAACNAGYQVLSDAFGCVRYVDKRSRRIAFLYPVGTRVPPEERKTLMILRHALGLKDPIGEGTAYRNNYALFRNSDDYELCMSLCDTNGKLPLLGHRPVDHMAEGMVYFHVTITGKDFVDKRIGMSTETD